MAIKKATYKQLDLGIGHGTAQVFPPVSHVVEGAKRYAQSKGRSLDRRGLDSLQDDPQRGHATAQAYERGMRQPTASHTRQSYENMRQEINDQHDFMTRPESAGGMGFTYESVPEDPYANPTEMHADISNKRIKVLSTAVTGSHAVFSDEENDKFRAVHDVFGHGTTGRGFSRHGEEAAWRSHSQVFSPGSHEALATDLRAQNQWANYHSGAKAGVENFIDQTHIPSLPKWTQSTGPLPAAKGPNIKSQGTQQILF